MRIIVLLLSFALTQIGVGQEAMRVERCTAISPDAPVFNIHIDENDNKWVTNSEGLFQVHAADLATAKAIPTGEESLLQIPDGNHDVRWPSGALNGLLNGALSGSNEIISGYYNAVQDHLWIGTSEAGLFMFRTQPKLKWVKEVNRRMPKLRSNIINTIYVDGDEDRHFFGTDEGVLVGRGGRWGLEERFFRFQAITHRGQEVWLLAEDLIWIVNEKDDWRSIDIDPENVQGAIKDIALDKDGRLWIASEYLTVYDPERETYRIFDGADYFTSSDVNCLAVDRTGAVWVGTQDKGLYLIEKESAMTVTCLVEQELSCVPGEDNGALVVKINGGQPPYQYKWGADLVGDNPKGLGPGNYVVTVTDSRGQSKAAEGVIADTRLHLEIKAEQPATPDGSSRGSAVATVEGGKPKYIYQWDNGESGPRAENLTSGLHNLTVTDANGCKAESSVEISQEIAELVLSLERTGVSKCAGDGLNAVRALAEGGLAPYTYSWNESTLQGSEVTDLKAGQYYLTVSDAQGKSASTSINIEGIDALELVASVNAAASTGNADGRASVKATGGTGKYTYAWDNGETTKSVTNLSPGKHTVTVTDEQGCAQEASVDITEDISELSIALNMVNEIKCHGDQSGALEVQIRGGKGPFTFTWNDGNLQGEKAEGLSGGTYSLTITDVVGNVANASIDLEEPEALSVEVIEQRGVTDEASSDGRAELSVTGGTGNYAYQWDNDFTGAKVENLTLGSHSVTVTDASGCSVRTDFETKQKILPQLSLSKLRTGQVVQMQMLQFDADSTNINDAAKPVLDEVYQFLKDNPAVVIRVEGHTNNIPPDEFCDKLSTARAKSVAVYIVQQGIADERVYYKGYGKRNPIYSNRTAEGRRKNQRVEINILKVKEDGP